MSSEKHRTNSIVFSIIIDFSCSIFALVVARGIRLASWSPFIPLANLSLSLTLLIASPCIWLLVFAILGIYDADKFARIRDRLRQTIIGSIFATFVLAGLLYLTERDLSRGFFITYVATNSILLILWRILGFLLLWKRKKRQRVLIVGAGEVGQRLAMALLDYESERIDVIGFSDDQPQDRDATLPILGPTDSIDSLVDEHNINTIVVALPLYAYEKISHIAYSLQNRAVDIMVVPDFFSLALYKASAYELQGVPLINLRAPALSPFQRAIKRLFDLIVSAILLVLCSPIIALIVVAIWFFDGAPIFFRQPRVGENGEIFLMYKFRTMIVDADKQPVDETKHKQRLDPRVTKIGRILRRYSLDELPQFFNVVIGDMSLVGPRPEMPWLADRYQDWQRTRFVVPQGMTGWWQIHGRADRPMHLHTSDDLYYIQNYSIAMDIYILLKTPLVVLAGDGAF